jgi:hypothetical protein
MINWKELEKFIVPGKVCTLIILIDGKELCALSFNVDTLAYKTILESVSNIETIPERIHIAEKPIEKKTEPIKKPEPIKKADKNDKTGKHPEFNPVPAHEEKHVNKIIENAPMTRESVLIVDNPEEVEEEEEVDEEIEEVNESPTLSEEW